MYALHYCTAVVPHTVVGYSFQFNVHIHIYNLVPALGRVHRLFFRSFYKRRITPSRSELHSPPDPQLKNYSTSVAWRKLWLSRFAQRAATSESRTRGATHTLVTTGLSRVYHTTSRRQKVAHACLVLQLLLLLLVMVMGAGGGADTCATPQNGRHGGGGGCCGGGDRIGLLGLLLPLCKLLLPVASLLLLQLLRMLP